MSSMLSKYAAKNRVRHLRSWVADETFASINELMMWFADHLAKSGIAPATSHERNIIEIEWLEGYGKRHTKRRRVA